MAHRKSGCGLLVFKASISKDSRLRRLVKVTLVVSALWIFQTIAVVASDLVSEGICPRDEASTEGEERWGMQTSPSPPSGVTTGPSQTADSCIQHGNFSFAGLTGRKKGFECGRTQTDVKPRCQFSLTAWCSTPPLCSGILHPQSPGANLSASILQPLGCLNVHGHIPNWIPTNKLELRPSQLRPRRCIKASFPGRSVNKMRRRS